MARIDESSWVVVHDASHIKNNPWQRFPVVLTLPTDKLLLTVSKIDAKATWFSAGWLYQFWERGLTSVLVVRKKIPLNQIFLASVEPVEASTLWFAPEEWIVDFDLRIEARELALGFDSEESLTRIENRIENLDRWGT